MPLPILLFATIKRGRLLRAISSFSSLDKFLTGNTHLTDTRCNHPPKYSKWQFSTTNSLPIYNSFSSCRSYSTTQSSDLNNEFADDLSGATDYISNEVIDFNSPSQIAETLVDVGSGTESIFPVRAVISMLDGYHNLTGLPWWIVIASSTLALRLVLLPVLIYQLKKLAKIAELMPKLPPPLPPPMSGKSYKDHYLLFRKERKSVGCPSFLWFLGYISVQFPCFILWMTSIRRMALDHHPGLDSGGILWFQNLTELPHGLSGPILPLLIGGIYFINVQVSFRNSSTAEVNDIFGLLAKYYKIYVKIMTLPIIFTAGCVPQASEIYWITNGSITLLQTLTLGHPVIRHKLGLPDAVEKKSLRQEISEPALLFDPSKEQKKVWVQNLSPLELLKISVQYLSEGKKVQAIPLLRLALEKDPMCVGALIALGRIQGQNGIFDETIELLERAISTLYLAGQPTELEDVDNLILASQWAGSVCVRQGKITEGIAHFERIASLKEPEDPKSKACYYESLVLLASTLCREGRKDEASKYLRMAAAYSPTEYQHLLEQYENDDDDIVSDLAEISEPELLFDPSKEQEKVSVQNLSPLELLKISAQYLSKGKKVQAISLLRLALEKDPKCVKALNYLGQLQSQNGIFDEAIELFERAISTLYLTGQPTEIEDVRELILASQFAGSIYIQQGKITEGLVHLERIASLKAPEDPKTRAYYEGLLLLQSTLYSIGRKDEAGKYLRMAAAYSPTEFQHFLEQIKTDDDSIVSDLAESRRRDDY